MLKILLPPGIGRARTFLLCAATAAGLSAQTFTKLYDFCSQTNCADGAEPTAGLLQATDGDFYGATGSTPNPYPPGGACGTIFKITPAGSLTTLYTFGSDAAGYYPGALIQATNGNFYGTSYGLDVQSICPGPAPACGTVFTFTPGGTLRTLYGFCSQSPCPEGVTSTPNAPLVQATNGALYGTTRGVPFGSGTFFRITPSGQLKTLYTFGAVSVNPEAGLIQATNGAFYGTTDGGGPTNAGTVFRITPSGTLKTVYNFCSQAACADGQSPATGLVQATDGNFYGTTFSGGAKGYGTVSKLTPRGKLITLHSFCIQSGCPDGAHPIYGALIQATDGNLYGETSGIGGQVGPGSVFKIAPTGEFTTLYTFCSQSGCADGQAPQGGLIEATNGTLYGTTTYGGSHDEGTVFSLSVGLGPFVRTQTSSGRVGSHVTILGTNLTGATAVTFNGIAARFTVNSTGSAISTNVPRGATTGTVRVATPAGMLSSNIPYRVL